MKQFIKNHQRLNIVYQSVILAVVFLLAAPVAAADLCPNTIFDDGMMWSGDIQYVENTCSNAEQVCAQTYFSDLGARFTAVCNGAKWIQEGAVAETQPEPEPEIEPEASVMDLCPNTLFNDGKMWSGDIRFVDNTCSNEGQVCMQTYFSHLAQRLDSECANGSWQQAGITPEPEIEPEPEPESNSANLCPNTIFDNGKMWSGDIQFVDNTCTETDKLCSGVYFSDAAGRFDASCTGTQWVAVGRDSNEESNCGADACYRVTLRENWNATTFPTRYPAGSHFSPLVGSVHGGSADFFELNQSASIGIERMAELGTTSPLISEVEVAINSGTALSVILGDGIPNGRTEASVEIELSSAFPLVTLVSMVAPSPDWFVGVDGLSLQDTNGSFIERLEVPLEVLDAGTDRGVTFFSANSDSDSVITKLTCVDLVNHCGFVDGQGTDGTLYIGVMIFEKI